VPTKQPARHHCTANAHKSAQVPGSGYYRFIDNAFWKERYCTKHKNGDVAAVECTSCLRLRLLGSDDMVAIGDGRHSCLMCLELMVLSTAEAQPLYRSILEWCALVTAVLLLCSKLMSMLRTAAVLSCSGVARARRHIAAS
jgi:hypothetical protein